MTSRGAPLRFVATVLSLWAGGRALWLMDTPEAPAIASRSPRAEEPKAFSTPDRSPLQWVASRWAATPSQAWIDVPLPPPASFEAPRDHDEPLLAQVSAPAAARREMLAPALAEGTPRLDLDQAVRAASRWSGSGWVFVRDRSAGRSLATQGQLGGSQAGAIVRWRINRGDQVRTALYGRASAPLDHPDGAEAAIGAEWHPLPGQPVWIAAERRIAVGKDGRNAWAAYAAGGIWKSGLPLGLTFDGYAQAGVVSTKRRDLFADGAARLSKPLSADGPSVGAGVWGAAQPGASRLDIGPQARLPLKFAKQPMSLSADYRVRVAGEARPGSGVAVTLASDF